MARDGKLVVRPDSGDPVKIICGDKSLRDENCDAFKGSIQVLCEIFGCTINSKGYKQLDPHVGLIYGDSITLDRCEEICYQLEKMGFASTNIVLGIGSYTYQHVTRDTFGFAMKSTYGVINGNPCEIFKKPKTDDGIKNSAKGLLRVNEDLTLSECVTPAEEKEGLLRTVFADGVNFSHATLAQIREKIKSQMTPYYPEPKHFDGE
jgi:nicotinamide phosphoribosyltransferase